MNDRLDRKARSGRWLWMLCLLSCGAFAGDWQETLPDARLLGSGELRLFGVPVYSASLYSAVPVWQLGEDTPFALELTYHRRIGRDRLVGVGVEEIRRLYGDRVDLTRLAQWGEEMRQAFVDVEPGERITGVFRPGFGVNFYVGGELRHVVPDCDFARAFFSIWLDPRARHPHLRDGLLGVAEYSTYDRRPSRVRGRT